jgi:hypothetical protein
MIQNDDQLKSTQEALAKLEEAMAALSRRKADLHPDRFVLMAEPLLDHIRDLRTDIDTYTGIAAAEAELAQITRGGV